MKNLIKTKSETILIITNLVPLLGALFLGWDISSLVLIYWCESTVIGLFNVVKMVKSKDEGIIKFILVPFFIIHYSLFMGVHLVFIRVLFKAEFSFWILFWPVLAMLVSHGYSLAVNYFQNGVYKNTPAGVLFFSPYKRIVIMQVTVLIGGSIFMFLAPYFPNTFMPALFLIIIKTFADWKSHNKEHFNIFKGLDNAAGENKKTSV